MVNDLTPTGKKPSLLCELIRHPSNGRLRLSRPEELASFERTIPKTDAIDTALSDWRAISFMAHYANHHFERVHLLGDELGQPARGKISSPLRAIDLGTGLAVTRSGSIYRLLGSPGVGEPPVHHLRLISAALWAWGHGKELDVVYPGHRICH